MIALLIASPGINAEPSAAEVGELIARIESARTTLGIPAVALTLVGPDRVLWSGTMGVADLHTGRRADDGTVFRIGSITKMFTALAMLIAADDGLIELDAPATAIVPDFPMQNPWADTHPVRVEHLLEHTAGLPDLSREEFDHNVPMDLRAALAWKVADRRALWPPGLHHSYSNVGAGLAALLLEEVTGRPYEDFVRERIFLPLGMSSAGFDPDPQTLSQLATGYDADGKTVIPYWHMLYRAFGAINVLPAQTAAFMQMLLNHGRYQGRQLVSAAAIDRMETPATTLAAGTGLRYGYGLGNYTWWRRGVVFHGHGGDGDGYLARLGYSRERGLGYFVVINVYRNADLDRIRHLIEDFIAGQVPVPPPPPFAIAQERLNAYAGRYESVTSRFSHRAGTSPDAITIEIAGTGLRLQRNGRIRKLVPVNDRHFRREHDSVATSAFIEHEGRIYFQDDGGNYARIRR